MRVPVVLALAVAAGAWSCSQSNQPKEHAGALESAKPQAAAPAKSGGGSAAYPKGAQWTILCREFRGADHVVRARQTKEAVMKTPGMRDWHILHKENESVLYYGYYKTYNDPRAQADRKKIDSMTDANGRRPFSLAVIQPLNSADVGPPEWNLANAKGAWSLQIGVYMDSPERKQYAVDAVKEARAQGIEAYYYHGETMSLVCVGSWPLQAVRVADTLGSGGEQGKPKLVIPDLPEGAQAPIIRDKQGQRLHVESPRNEVVDPTLKAMMEKYPTNAINGETMLTSRTDPRTGRVVTTPDPSLVVPIPQRDASMLDGGTSPVAPPDQPLIDPSRRETPGSRLKTVGS